jgi:hypothetical protein
MADEPSLYEGDVDVDGWVETLQLALRRAGSEPEMIDGKFGWRTARAVQAFQGAHGLEADGVVGNQTWAALMGCDPEAPGVNNGPHGGLYDRPHAASVVDAQIPGAGWMPEPAQLRFTTLPTFDGSAVYVGLDVVSTGNLAVTLWAELSQDGGVLETSGGVSVTTTGMQTIPLGQSYAPGTYDLSVYATDNAGTTIDNGLSFPFGL